MSLTSLSFLQGRSLCSLHFAMVGKLPSPSPHYLLKFIPSPSLSLAQPWPWQCPSWTGYLGRCTPQDRVTSSRWPENEAHQDVTTRQGDRHGAPPAAGRTSGEAGGGGTYQIKMAKLLLILRQSCRKSVLSLSCVHTNMQSCSLAF